LRKFLGLVGYCCLWINSYAFKTKSLYLKLTQEGPDRPPPLDPWGDRTSRLPKAAPMLALPSLEQPFHLFVNVNKMPSGW
jgi:hypothetical protein